MEPGSLSQSVPRGGGADCAAFRSRHRESNPGPLAHQASVPHVDLDGFNASVERRGIEPRSPGCKPGVFPLSPPSLVSMSHAGIEPALSSTSRRRLSTRPVARRSRRDSNPLVTELKVRQLDRFAFRSISWVGQRGIEPRFADLQSAALTTLAIDPWMARWESSPLAGLFRPARALPGRSLITICYSPVKELERRPVDLQTDRRSTRGPSGGIRTPYLIG